MYCSTELLLKCNAHRRMHCFAIDYTTAQSAYRTLVHITSAVYEYITVHTKSHVHKIRHT